MCTYCAKWYPTKVMTPMYERNREYVYYYCEKFVPVVKADTQHMTWVTWGKKGETK